MYSCVDNGYIQPYPMTDYSYSGMEQELGTNHSRKSKRRRVTTPVQRKAANVRERKRMFSLNDAFDKLRKVSCRLSLNPLNLTLDFLQSTVSPVKYDISRQHNSTSRGT